MAKIENQKPRMLLLYCHKLKDLNDLMRANSQGQLVGDPHNPA